jgi:hypothetical protein
MQIDNGNSIQFNYLLFMCRLVIILFNLIRIYLRANLTAQRPITMLERERSKK